MIYTLAARSLTLSNAIRRPSVSRAHQPQRPSHPAAAAPPAGRSLAARVGEVSAPIRTRPVPSRRVATVSDGESRRTGEIVRRSLAGVGRAVREGPGAARASSGARAGAWAAAHLRVLRARVAMRARLPFALGGALVTSAHHDLLASTAGSWCLKHHRGRPRCQRERESSRHHADQEEERAQHFST